MSNSLKEISSFPTVNTNNSCFSMKQDQPAPVVIQSASDLLYHGPKSHIQCFAFCLNTGSETPMQNSANIMFSDSDMMQTYKKKPGQGLPLILDQTIQKSKSALPQFYHIKTQDQFSNCEQRTHLPHLSKISRELGNKIIITNVCVSLTRELDPASENVEKKYQKVVSHCHCKSLTEL